jgi:hypothetical protein
LAWKNNNNGEEKQAAGEVNLLYDMDPNVLHTICEAVCGKLKTKKKAYYY